MVVVYYYTIYAIVVNQLLLCLSSAYSHCPYSLLFNVCMLFCVRLRVGLVPVQSMRGCWAHVYSVFSFTEWWRWWWRRAYYSSSFVCTTLRRRVLSCLSFRVSLHRGHWNHYRRLLCKPSRSLLHHCAVNFSGHRFVLLFHIFYVNLNISLSLIFISLLGAISPNCVRACVCLCLVSSSWTSHLSSSPSTAATLDLIKDRSVSFHHTRWVISVLFHVKSIWNQSW